MTPSPPVADGQSQQSSPMTLPIVGRLRSSARRCLETESNTFTLAKAAYEAAATIEELVEALNLAAKRLSQAGVGGASRSTIKVWADEAFAVLTKLGGGQ